MQEIPRRRSEFLSFDGAVRLTAPHQRPDRYRHLDDVADGPLIARGGGYSYAAASFGADSCTLEMRAFDRLLAFDASRATLTVEAGARLIDVLQWSIARGFQLPVVPGYPLVTIGGCIAADVHGKDPWRDGTFSDWVKALTVFHPAKGYRTVTPDSDCSLFELTCGGFGLTGVIVDATLQLTRFPGTKVELISQPVSRLAEAVERLAASEDDFSYSWHDLTLGRRFGRGVVSTGRWTEEASGDVSLRYRPMCSESRAALPFSVWNRLSVRSANAVYYRLNRKSESRRRVSLLEAAFPLAKNPLYLTGFGRAGLREMQMLFDAGQINSFITAFERLAARERPPLVMASLKRFRGRQRALSPSGSGYLIAIDLLPGKAADRIMAQLDDLMLEMGGQPNLSKDSRISGDVVGRSIRNYATFAERLRRYDPSRRFRSELSERLGF